MPNTGKPSRDCHLCRTRRVKCDLTKPACLRCATYGMPCPGYRKEQELVFRNKDAGHFGGWRPRQNPPHRSLFPSASPTSNSGGKGPDPEQQPPALTISFPLSGDPTEYAVAFLLARFHPATDASAPRCSLSFFPLLYREIPPDSCLVLVTRALSDAYVANQRGGYSSGDAYGRALRSVNGALGDPVKSGSDETAMAVWLLSVYEVLVFPPPTPAPARRAWHAHSTGLLSLLRLRGTAQFATRRGRNIFWTMFGMIMIRYITATRECPPECFQWLNALHPILHDADLLPFAVYTYLLDVSALLPKLLRPACEESSVSALAAMPSLLRALDTVERSFRPPRDTSPGTLHFWGIHSGGRVKLHHCLVLLLLFAETAPSLTQSSQRAIREQRGASLVIIQEEVQRILDTVEKIMPAREGDGGEQSPSWLDALRVLWPLSIVARVATAPVEQREVAARALRRIKGDIGFQRGTPTQVETVIVPAEVERVSGRDSMLEMLLAG